MDILYYGEKDKESCFMQYAESQGLSYKCNHVMTVYVEDISKEVIRLTPKELIIDADCLVEEDIDKTANLLFRIKEAVHCDIIIVAYGYDKESSALLSSLRREGFYKFITSAVLGTAKEEYAACHENRMPRYEQTPEDRIKQVLGGGEVYSDIENGKQDAVTIAVAGCMHRMGTTTFCLQLAKYLSFTGKKVAYLERNDSGYVKSMAETFNCDFDEESSFVSLSGIDMYFDLALLKQIKKKNYDFLLYDYGPATDKNIVSFLEQKEGIIVCGVKGEEMSKTYEILKQFYTNDNLWYCFNFISPAEYSEIKEMMGRKVDKTMFLGFTPEALQLESVNMPEFERFLPNSVQEEVLPKEKKKGLFRFG
jgi:hypothetical protein